MTDEVIELNELTETDEVVGDKDTDSFLNEMVEETKESSEPKEKEEVVEPEQKQEEEKEEPKPEDVKAKNKANAERRIKEKEQRKSVDRLEIEHLREQYNQANERIQKTEPVLRYLFENKVSPDELKLGVDFAKRWQADRIGTVKTLLTSLVNDGIDIEKIVNHTDNGRYEMQREVDRRVQPYVQQQQAYDMEMQSRQAIENFFAQYPDAEMHTGEIAEVMKRTGINNPVDAYFRLRRAYDNHNIDWFGDSNDTQEQATMPMDTRNVVPQKQSIQPKSINDLVTQNTRNFFRR